MLPDLPQTEVAIVEMTNAFRKASALQEVKPNPVLAAAARAFAEYLARTGKFAHEADGRKPEERAQAQGYRLLPRCREPRLEPQQPRLRKPRSWPVRSWRAGRTSPGHRDNLLLRGATEIGVAVVRVPDKNPKFRFGAAVRPAGVAEGDVQHPEPVRQGCDHYTLGTETDLLQPRETVTHADCDPRPLSVDKAGEGPRASIRATAIDSSSARALAAA